MSEPASEVTFVLNGGSFERRRERGGEKEEGKGERGRWIKKKGLIE